MLPKVLRTIFLALGLAMIWLGVLYQYELKRQPALTQELEEESYYGELELYTLADDNYAEEDEALSAIELMPQHVTDFSITFNPQESLLPTIEQEVQEKKVTKTEKVYADQQVQEAGIGRLPWLLIAVGGIFLFCGVLSCKLRKEL